MANCRYRSSSTGAACGRPEELGAGGLCFFHSAKDRDPGVFSSNLEKLIAAGDGDWRGFVFPNGFELGPYSSPATGPRRIDVMIDARGSTLGSVTLQHVQFSDTVNFSSSSFRGPVKLRACTFDKAATFERCEFRDSVWISTSFAGLASFSNCVFYARTKFLGAFLGDAHFAGCTFLDNVEFVGAIDSRIYAGSDKAPDSTKRRLFFGRADFALVTFKAPERVQFRMVDLRSGIFYGTAVDKVSFVDVEWYQDALRRRGLFEEVRIRESSHPELLWPTIEATYRNVRRALEISKDFNAASDFYIGEMNARRQQQSSWHQRLFSVETLYGWLSRYGTSPGRAALVLIGVLLVHLALSAYALAGPCVGSSDDIWRQASMRTIGLLSLIRSPALDPLPGWWFLLGSTAQIAVAAQLAMLIVALRSRIKRG